MTNLSGSTCGGNSWCSRSSCPRCPSLTPSQVYTCPSSLSAAVCPASCPPPAATVTVTTRCQLNPAAGSRLGRKLVLLNPGVQLAVITASTGIDGAALRQRRRMICPTGRHQHCVAVKQRPICKPRRRPQAARTPHNRTRVGCQRLSQSPLGGAATCRTGAGSPATHVLAAHCFWNLGVEIEVDQRVLPVCFTVQTAPLPIVSTEARVWWRRRESATSS